MINKIEVDLIYKPPCLGKATVIYEQESIKKLRCGLFKIANSKMLYLNVVLHSTDW